MIDFAYTIDGSGEPMREGVSVVIRIKVVDEYAKALIILDEIREAVASAPDLLKSL